MLYEECGGSGLLDSSELQRFWRDTNAAAAHRGLTGDWIYAGWSKTLLGVQPDPGFLF
jgi:Acyl-CoA dehydrogenase, C-terminal domain